MVIEWCGITLKRVVGPFIFCDTMNDERYLAMLQDDKIWPVVNTWRQLKV